MNRTLFGNRRQAGKALADELAAHTLDRPVVLALPRGGVPVGYEVARALHAPLDILLVCKIGAPGHQEYGIGALVDGASPQVIVDEAAARAVGASPEYIDREVGRQLAEIERRRKAYCTNKPIVLADRTVVVVDDGIATGGTMRVALQALARVGCRRLIVAVPVAPPDVLGGLRRICDEVVCLVAPDPFYAVGAHYGDFMQTDDAEVVRLLAEARRRADADKS